MRNKGRPLTKATLQSILTEFPTHDWSVEELDELVSPKHGIITGFQDIIEDIRNLTDTDLKAIEPAGNLPFKK